MIMNPDRSLPPGAQSQSVSRNVPDPGNSMPPVVSVIIPAYNYARFLPCTLKNILAETDVATEIIVVDDGSTDGTGTVAASFGDAIRYIRQENQGLSAARNTGLRVAKGEFIVFLDADDLLYPGTLLSQYETFKLNPEADLAVCHNLFFSETDLEGTFVSSMGFPLPGEALALDFCYHNIAPVHAYMVRRSTTDKTGFFDISLLAMEDYDYWLRCVTQGGRIAVNPLGLALYRQHGQSMSKNLRQQLLHEALLRGKVENLLENSDSFMKGLKANGWIAHAARCFDLAVSLSYFAKGEALELAHSGGKALKNAANVLSSSETNSLHADGAKNFTLYYALLCWDFLNNLSSAGMGYFQDARKNLKELYSEVSLGKQQRKQLRKELYACLMRTTSIHTTDFFTQMGVAKDDA